MQVKWDDLRIALAVARAGDFAGAAKRLGVDDTTVSRRVKAAEAALGARLFQRGKDGRLTPTAAGRAAAERMERMEAAAEETAALCGASAGRAAGVVRLTAAPILANHVLAPALPALFSAHPEVQVELAPEPRDLSLSRREADLALRLARPRAGGARVVARRIGELAYAGFASAAISPKTAQGLPWIGYDEALAHLPPADWAARAARRGAGLAPLKVTDAATAMEAAAAGLGRAVLPRIVGQADPRLIEAPDPGAPQHLARELWLLAHADQRDRPAARAVIDWIDALAWSC